MTAQWTLVGADGQAIHGICHSPESEALGTIVLCHGFKGYMDYGMFPRIAEELSRAGFVAHRFNFSHSGMTRDIETFARPDLFECDTWSRQVEDLGVVMRAIEAGEIEGNALPLIVFGHSRGGVSVLLRLGLDGRDGAASRAAGAVIAATPSACCSLSDEDRATLLEQGYLESPSARTGQTLRVGAVWLREQMDDPESHDLGALAANVSCPVLIAHGESDPTVPVEHASVLAAAIGPRARVLRIREGNHVFNVPNPLPANQPMSPQLEQMISAMTEFSSELCRRVTAG